MSIHLTTHLKIVTCTNMRTQLAGPEWFETRYKRKNEKRLSALTRLSVESGLQIKTLYRACIHSLPVRDTTARALKAVRGGKSLDMASLVLPGERRG